VSTYAAPFSVRNEFNFLIVNIDEADPSIRYAFKEQAAQETFAFLLGDLPKI
jgi:hypothetical protein